MVTRSVLGHVEKAFLPTSVRATLNHATRNNHVFERVTTFIPDIHYLYLITLLGIASYALHPLLHVVNLLPLIPHPQRFLGSLDTTQRHGAKCRAHPVGTIPLTQLHTADNQARHNLTCALDNSVLGRSHVKTTHTLEALSDTHTDETLNAESAKGPIVAAAADDEGSVDGVGVHAGLGAVIEGDEGPVGNDAGDAESAVGLRTGDEVFDAGGIEELDVGKGEDFGHEGGGEEGGVLDDDKVAFVVVRDTDVAEEGVGGFAHHHGGEELAAEPGTTTWRDGGLGQGLVWEGSGYER